MLTSILGLRSPLASIITPNFLTLTLLPPDTDKSPSDPRTPSSQPPSSPPTTTAQDDPSPKTLATISLFSATLGLAAMSAAQSLTAYLLLLSLFGPSSARTYTREFLRADVSSLTPGQLADRAAMARDPLYAAVFLPLLTTLSIALPEELLKYLPVLWLGRQKGGQGGDRKRVGKRAAVRAVTAASLAFAVVELAGYVYAAAAVPTGPPMAVTLAERVFVALPGHLATAVLSASRGADADADAAAAAGAGDARSGWRAALNAVAPSVVYHSLFDLVLIGSSALVGGHVGWVHPEGMAAVVGTLGACACLQVVLYAHTARAWLGWGVKDKGE